MKSKFEIYHWWESWNSIIKERSDMEKVYIKHYSEDGFEYNSVNDSLSKMFDKEYNLSIGDTVYIDDYYQVCDKWVDLQSDYVHYMLAEEGEQFKQYVNESNL